MERPYLDSQTNGLAHINLEKTGIQDIVRHYE